MDCSMPGLPELTQTHVHGVNDDTQPSHPLSSPSPPAFNLSQSQGLFKWVWSRKVLLFPLVTAIMGISAPLSYSMWNLLGMSFMTSYFFNLHQEVFISSSLSAIICISEVGPPWWLSDKESACQCRRHEFHPWVGKVPWRRKWQPTSVSLPGKSHGQEVWRATVHGVAESRTWLSD